MPNSRGCSCKLNPRHQSSWVLGAAGDAQNPPAPVHRPMVQSRVPCTAFRPAFVSVVGTVMPEWEGVVAGGYI